MRRDLPARANLEHLKKQAKDLKDAHGRGDPEALRRIREALPSYRSASDEAIAGAPFALHDAQSAIAREYGETGWQELRARVAAMEAEAPLSEEALRALLPLPFPPEVGALLRDAAGDPKFALAAAEEPLPGSLPLVAMRNAMFLPRAIGPIHVASANSRAAVEIALEQTPPTLAVFARRAARDETPTRDSLHAVGVEAYAHATREDGAGGLWVVLEGLRWVGLDALDEGPRGSQAVRVRAVEIEPGDPAEIATLTASLRAHARDLARAFPDGARLVARIDAAEPDRLADLVVANLPVSVDEKARYAGERRLAERLRIAAALAGC